MKNKNVETVDKRLAWFRYIIMRWKKEQFKKSDGKITEKKI